MDRPLVLVDEEKKGPDPAFVMEDLLPEGLLFAKDDGQGGIEVSQLPEPVGQDIEGEGVGLHDGEVGIEADGGSGGLRGSGDGQRRLRDPLVVDLAKVVPLLVDVQKQRLGEGVHHRDPDTVKSSRHLVGVVVELASGMKDGQDDLGRRPVLFGMHPRGDPASVVLHRHRAIGVKDHLDGGAVSRQGFVDAVVHQLVDEVVEAVDACASDIHAGTDANGLETFENADLLFAVSVLDLRVQIVTLPHMDDAGVSKNAGDGCRSFPGSGFLLQE